MRRALREAGLWFAADAAPGIERAERARELFRFLLENRAGTSDWWGGLLESQLRPSRRGRCTGSSTTTWAITGRPSGSRIRRARRGAAGLAYVGECDLTTMLPERVPAAVAGELEAIPAGTGSGASS